MIVPIEKNKGKDAIKKSTLPTVLNKDFMKKKTIDPPPTQLTLNAVNNCESNQKIKSEQFKTKHPIEKCSLLGKITEIITSDEQSSSLTMLLPLLATLSKDDRWFAWVSPPKNLPRALLVEAGIDLDKVMLLYPDDQNSGLNLAKKALSAGTCHAVISWSGNLSEHELANLELSAKRGASHGIVIRKRNH